MESQIPIAKKIKAFIGAHDIQSGRHSFPSFKWKEKVNHILSRMPFLLNKPVTKTIPKA